MILDKPIQHINKKEITTPATSHQLNQSARAAATQHVSLSRETTLFIEFATSHAAAARTPTSPSVLHVMAHRNLLSN
jgi:hypothetical protein